MLRKIRTQCSIGKFADNAKLEFTDNVVSEKKAWWCVESWNNQIHFFFLESCRQQLGWKVNSFLCPFVWSKWKELWSLQKRQEKKRWKKRISKNIGYVPTICTKGLPTWAYYEWNKNFKNFLGIYVLTGFRHIHKPIRGMDASERNCIVNFLQHI